MSGPKKDKVILSEQGVVTEEALTAYLQNKLSPEEKQQLEKLLQEDPFARDALEGLQSSANQTGVHTSISALNKKVRERSGLKEHKRLKLHWVSYAWAAVVLGLLIGIGFVMVNFLNRKDNNLAVNSNKENVTAPALPLKDTMVSEKPKVVMADSTVSSRPVTDTATVSVTGGAAQSKPAPTEPQKEADNVAANPVTNKAPQPVALQTTVPSGQKAAEFSKSKADTSKHITANAYKYNLAVTPDNKDAGALQDDAMKSFNSGDYATAGDDFDKILKHDPDNADALYFGGISDYINGKTAKSENNFDKLLKKGNKYMEGSKWYKANILIKKGHSDAAKPLLQDLSNSNGSYKERAIKKLADMGF
jgi:tetratricopeptide (TPR) repeat protein